MSWPTPARDQRAHGRAAVAVLQEWDSAPLPTTFAVQLLQRLRDHDPTATPALTWLEGRLSAAERRPTRSFAMNITARVHRA